MKTLKYFQKQYLYGKIPSDFKEKISNKNYDIINLQIREINSLFSDKYETVVPCIKQNPNKCKDLNEFDYEKQDKYNGISITNEENPNIKTIYQIDKSSESFLINSNLIIHFVNEKNGEFLEYYLSFAKLKEINEPEILEINVLNNQLLTLKLQCFTDNIEKIYDKIIELLKEIPNDKDINFTRNNLISKYKKDYQIPLDRYTVNLFNEFLNSKKTIYDLDRIKRF